MGRMMVEFWFVAISAHRLKQPQLQGRRALQPVGGLPEALGGLVLALSRYDLGPPLALALGLAGHRPLHVLRDLHVLDLNHADLDPPGARSARRLSSAAPRLWPHGW